MPEGTGPHRTGPPANKALGPQEAASGSMAASEVNTNSAAAESSRMTNPVKARRRTKTGCLSKFLLVLWTSEILRSLICHSMPQAAYQVRRGAPNL